MRQTKRNINGLSGGGYANAFKVNLDTGATIDEIVLKTENLNIDQVTQVELMLNGSPIVFIEGAHLVKHFAHNGNDAESNKIRIEFRDYEANTDAGQTLSSLVTLNDENLTLIVRTGAATQAQIDGNKVPGLSGYVLQSAARSRRIVRPRIYRTSISANATGEVSHTTFLKGPALKQMYLEGGNVTRLRVLGAEQPGQTLELFDSTQADNDDDLKRHKKNPVTDTYVFNPVMKGWVMGDAFRTAKYQELDFRPTVSAAGDIPAVFHVLETEGNPRIDPFVAIAAAEAEERRKG